MSKKPATITSSSTAEYFSKNLQQVGFSSQTKAVLTTLKESMDNALDACEEHGVLPEIHVKIDKVGNGSSKNSDRIRILVEDNGPGISPDDVPKVFGEYLASSKFGRGRCSRGQQGIGISAATTWAQLTSAKGVKVKTKTAGMRKAHACVVEVDFKNNKGLTKDKETFDWDRPHGTSVEFLVDGRVQLNGEGGLLSYLTGNILVNPHLTLHYHLPESEPTTIARVSDKVPEIPEATEPHPHTMKLGEFISHSHLFGRVKLGAWLKKGFSRVSDGVIHELIKEGGLKKALFDKLTDSATKEEFTDLYGALQKVQLRPPSTQSVLIIGEEALSKSIRRLGDVDFFSVLSRKPTICDFKPVQVEVAVARLLEKNAPVEDTVQVLRFANRVPLQFDKSGCAITKAITTVNWRAYGLAQSKDAIPTGPYIIAVSVVSPFIKFKNASKETIDASDELVEEIRRALMQAGQRLSKHLRKENKAAELEEKIRHIEQFGPILVDGLSRICHASPARKKKAEEGLLKLLGRDAKEVKAELKDASAELQLHLEKHDDPLPDSEEVGAVAMDSELEDVPEKSKGAEKKNGKKSEPKAEKAVTKKTKAKK